MVLIAQGVYCNLFFVSYLVSPVYCHRLVGYLEEEAVKTYTHLIHDLDKGNIPEWEGEPAPPLAIKYGPCRFLICCSLFTCLPSVLTPHGSTLIVDDQSSMWVVHVLPCVIRVCGMWLVCAWRTPALPGLLC
jgi:Alternative oxidase